MTTPLRVCMGLALLAIGCNSQHERAADQWPIATSSLHAPPEVHGEATYRRYCVSCHGTDGRGNGGVTGADFVGTAAALALRSPSELEDSVREGKRGEKAVMPAHKPVLSSAQISEVVSYVRAQFITPNAVVAAQGTAAADAGTTEN